MLQLCVGACFVMQFIASYPDVIILLRKRELVALFQLYIWLFVCVLKLCGLFLMVQYFVCDCGIYMAIYEGCPSKSWTFVITPDCVQVTL